MAEKIKVSEIPVGSSIAIQEEDGYSSYSLVQHNYNSGVALLLRDMVVDQVQWMTSVSGSSSVVYPGSNLDTWLNNTWRFTLPSTTQDILEDVIYSVSLTNSGTSGNISRKVCTVSLNEILGTTQDSYHGSSLTSRPANIGVSYWTRQPFLNNTYVFGINTSGSQSISSPTSSRGARPCIGISETKLAAQKDDSTGFYYLSKAFTPPDKLYIEGLEQDVMDAHPERNYVLSWPAADGEVDLYQVSQTNVGQDGVSKNFFTTSTSYAVKSPSRGFKTSDVSLYVLPKGGDTYIRCGSRSISTRESHIHIFTEDGNEYLAKPKFFNGTTWNDDPNAMYYYDDDISVKLYGSDKATYHVDNLTEPGFEETADEWWVSRNKTDNSTAKCKIVINGLVGTKVMVQCVNSSEQSPAGCYDYGTISFMDSESILKTWQTDKSREVVTFDYGTITTAGEHYIYATYYKDISQSAGDDAFKFKVIQS